MLKGEGSCVGLVEVQVMGIGGRRGITESRKELNLLQTPLHHASPLFNFIIPPGPIVFLSRGHVGPVWGFWCLSYRLWVGVESSTLECGGVFFRHVVVCVVRREVLCIHGCCLRLRTLLMWFIDWLLWGLCV